MENSIEDLGQELFEYGKSHVPLFQPSNGGNVGLQRMSAYLNSYGENWAKLYNKMVDKKNEIMKEFKGTQEEAKILFSRLDESMLKVKGLFQAEYTPKKKD